MKYLGFLLIIKDGLSFLTKIEKIKLWQLFFLAIFGAAIDTLTLSLIAPLIGLIVNPDPWFANYYFNLFINIIGSKELNYLIFISGVVFCIAIIISVLLNIFIKYNFLKFSTDCRNNLAEKISNRILDAPYFSLNNKNAILNAKIINEDIPAWARLFLNKVLTMGNSVFLIIFVLIFCGFVAPLTSLIIMSTIAIFALILFLWTYKYFKNLANLTKIYMNGGVITGSELFLGVKEIKLYQKKEFFIKKFLFNYKNQGFVDTRLLTAREGLSLSLIGITQIGMVFTILMLYYFAENKSEIIIEISLVIVAISRLLPASSRVFTNIISLWDNKIRIDNIKDLERAVPKSPKKVLKVETGDFKSLKLENLSYKYENHDDIILKNINFEIYAGKKYGIVGSSGAGKTTLIDIIFGLLNPTEGKITLNNKILSKSRLISFQEKIMYVSQNNFILDSNFLHNILFGNSNSKKNKAKLLKSAKDANLLDVINSKPNKWLFKVGDRGSMLSGGQKQRISLARGFFKNASVLVLDEATNALDNVKEKEVLRTVWDYRPSLTVIIVAHRLSTVKDCDEIIVLEKGKIVGQDTYSNLIEKNKYFKKLALHESNLL